MKKTILIAGIILSIVIIALAGFALLLNQGVFFRNGIKLAQVVKDNHTTTVSIYFSKDNRHLPNVGNTDTTYYGPIGQICAHLAERTDSGDSIPNYQLPSLYNSDHDYRWYAKVSVSSKQGDCITPKAVLRDLLETGLVSSDTVFQPLYTIGLGDDYDYDAHGLALQDVLFIVRRCGMPASIDPSCNEFCPTKITAKDIYRCKSNLDRMECMKARGLVVSLHEHERMQVVTFVPTSAFKALAF